MLPGLAGVCGLVDAVSKGNITADKGLSCACPNNIGVGWSNGQGADGLDRLVVKDRSPVCAAVCGFPDAAGGSPDVINQRVAGYTDYGGCPVARRSDVAVLELAVDLRIELFIKNVVNNPG